MPYLRQAQRVALDGGAPPETAGELNYAITRLVQEFVFRNGGNYAAHNSAVGALECCKLEFYRRALAVYEDGKIQSNGDVYGPG